MEKFDTTARKPPGRELHVIAAVRVSPGQRVQVTERTRQTIERMVTDLWADGTPAEISRVVSRRLGVREAVVDAVMAGLMVQYKTEVAAFRAIVTGSVSLAADAGREIWEDVA